MASRLPGNLGAAHEALRAAEAAKAAPIAPAAPAVLAAALPEPIPAVPTAPAPAAPVVSDADLDALEASLAGGEPEPAAPAKPAAPAAAPAAPAAPANDPQARRIAELEGLLAASRTQGETQVAALIARVEAMERNKTAAPAAPTIDDTDLTPEELQQYESSLPVIDKRAKRLAKQMIAAEMAGLREQMGKLEKDTGTLNTGLAATTEANFVQSVRAAVQSSGGLDTIIKHPEWQKYLAQEVPLLGVPVADVLKQHHSNRNLDGVVKIFKGFKPETNPLAALEVPSSSGSAPAAPEPQRAARKLPISKLRQANEDFTRNRMTHEAYANIRKVYDKAEAEGRVLYDR